MTASRRRLRSHPLLIALAAVVFVLLAPIQAQAAFQKSVAASTTVASGTLIAPLTITASTNCGFLSIAYMTVNWTINPNTRATGYVVTAILNGTPQYAIAVTGRDTLTTPAVVNRNPLIGTPNTYTFQVQTVYTNWTSTAVTTTNPLSCGPL